MRTLLPPIPLPNDEKSALANSVYAALADEPILPGALPPRGPPKAGGEGPNKGVSKLQLLRCGNDFIRLLGGRVQRRDEEIDSLRREIRNLRLQLHGGLAQDNLVNDLEKNIDAVEAFGAALGKGNSTIMEEDGDYDGDD